MSQNPNDPNYNPYGSNPSYPNYPGTPPPGTAYGPQPPSRPDPHTPSQPYGPGYNNPYAPPPPPPPTGPYGTPPPTMPSTNPYDPYAPTIQSQGPSSPGYPAYNPPSSTPVTSPPQKKRNTGAIVILSVIALLIIAGGIIGFVVHNNQVITQNANATATAISELHSTATVQAQATATASAIASAYPFSNDLVLNDPLSAQDGNNWDNDGKFCFFSGSAYHVFNNQTETYQTCAALKTNFTDFTMQVEMLIKKGDDNSGGGLIFRGDEAGFKYYRLYVDSQGDYGILVSVDKTGSNGNARVLTTGVATQFTPGLQQTNTIGVVARGDQIAFYVNGQQVTTVTDSTYTHGQIGFTSDDVDADTEVVYNNLKVWKLA